MATYSLPPGWESDYDGVAEKWFFVHRPSGATQFVFPKEGDELKPVEMAQPQPQPQVATDVLAEKIDAMTISLDQQQRGQTPGPAPPPVTPQQAQVEPHYQSQNSGDWNQTAPLVAPAPAQPSEQPVVQGDYPNTASPPSNVSPHPTPAPLNYQNPQHYVQQQGGPPQHSPVPYQQPHHVQGVPGQIPQQVTGQPAPFNNQPQVQSQNVGQQYVNPQYAQRPQANQVIRRKPGPNQQRVASGQEAKPTSPGPQVPVYQVQQQNWQPQSPPTSQPLQSTQNMPPQQAPQGSVPIDRRQSGQFQPQQQTSQYQTQGLQTVQYQNIQQQHIQPAQHPKQGSVVSQQQPIHTIPYQGQPAHVQSVQQQSIMTPQPQYQVQNGIKPPQQPAQPSSQALPQQQQNPNGQPQYAQTYHQPQQYQPTPQQMQQNPQVPHSQGPPNSGVSQPAPGTFQIPNQSAMPTDPGNPLVPRPLQSMQPQSQGPLDNRRFSNIPNSKPQSISSQSPSNTPSPSQANQYPPPPLSSPQQGQPQHQAGQIPNQVIYQQPTSQGNVPQQPMQYTQSPLQSPQPVTPGNEPQGTHLYRAQSGPASSTFAQLVENSVIQAPGSTQNRAVQYTQQATGHPQYQGAPQSQFQQPANMQIQPVNHYSSATHGQIPANTGLQPFQMQTYQPALTAPPTATQQQIVSSTGRPGLMTRWSTGGLASSKKALDKSKGWMKKNPLGTLAIAGGLGIVAEAAGVNVVKDAKMAGKIYNGVQHVRAQNAHPHGGQKQPGQQHPQQGLSEAAMQAAIQKGIQDGIAKAMLQQGGHPGMQQGQMHPGQVPQGYQYSGHPGVQQGQVHHPQQQGQVHHPQQQQAIPGTRQIPGQQHPTHTQHHQQQQHFNPLQQFQQFITPQQHPHHNQHPQHHHNQPQQQAGSNNTMIVPDPTVIYTPDPSGSPTQSQTDFDTQSQGGDNSIGLVDNDNGSDGTPDFMGGDNGGGDAGLDFGGDSGGFDMSDALSDEDAAIF